MTIIIKENTVWSGNVVISDNYQVASGVTLTISPGTTLTRTINNSSYIPFGIEVFGSLEAIGTLDKKIIFEGWAPKFANYKNGSIILDNVNILNADSSSMGTAGKLIIKNSYIENSSIGLSSNLDGSEITNNVFNNSCLFILNANNTLLIKDNSFYGKSNNTTNSFIEIVSGGDLFTISGNNFYADSVVAISNKGKQDLLAQGNWFNTSNKNEIDGKIFDYYDNLNYGKVDYSGYLLVPNPKAPVQIGNTSEKHTLSVLVNAGVLGKSPVFLQNLVEDLTKVGGVIKTHTVTYGSSTYNYNSIDELITTVVRDGDFTSEFRKEIAELSPSASSITYPDLVSLVGKLNVDSTIQYIAGADGNYVG